MLQAALVVRISRVLDADSAWGRRQNNATEAKARRFVPTADPTSNSLMALEATVTSVAGNTYA